MDIPQDKTLDTPAVPITPTAGDWEIAALIMSDAAQIEDTDGSIAVHLSRAARRGWLILHPDGSPPTLAELEAKAVELAPLFAPGQTPDPNQRRAAGLAPLAFVISLHALAGAHASLTRPDPDSHVSTRDRIGLGRG